jgi:hypothetical protein
MDMDNIKATNYLRRLRWLLEPEETIELLARADVELSDWASRCLAVLTDRRLLLIDRRALMKGEPLTRELPLSGQSVDKKQHEAGRERVLLKHGAISGTLFVRNDETQADYNAISAAIRRFNDKPRALDA